MTTFLTRSRLMSQKLQVVLGPVLWLSVCESVFMVRDSILALITTPL